MAKVKRDRAEGKWVFVDGEVQRVFEVVGSPTIYAPDSGSLRLYTTLRELE